MAQTLDIFGLIFRHHLHYFSINYGFYQEQQLHPNKLAPGVWLRFAVPGYRVQGH
jgi:hypothetical protein